jgi:hypothetical protein
MMKYLVKIDRLCFAYPDIPGVVSRKSGAVHSVTSVNTISALDSLG